jgi:1,4-alpha-glucan branching enzyme
MKRKITFTLPAEALAEATEALLLGDFNDWNTEKGIALKKQKDGTLRAVTELEAGKTYQYRFLLNDGRWVNDYNAENYVTVSGYHIENSMVTVAEVLDAAPKAKKETAAKAVAIKAPAKKKAVSKEVVFKGVTANAVVAPKAKVAKAKVEKVPSTK